MIERILVPGVMEPVSHYCHVVRAGRLVWVSGVVGMDGKGDVPESVVAQFNMAIDVMDNGVLSFIPPTYTAAGNWGQIKQVYDDIARKFLDSGRIDDGYLRDMQAKIEGYK